MIHHDEVTAVEDEDAVGLTDKAEIMG